MPRGQDVQCPQLLTSQDGGARRLTTLQYGFGLQYQGPPLMHAQEKPPNHTSAREYPAHVEEYLTKEAQEGALIGPLDFTPFTPWCVYSPMMTRPKYHGRKRRIIVDLSFPEGGVNQHISKNVVDGVHVIHTLPTTQDAVKLIHQCASSHTHMAAIDVSSAYRNFRVCPADWPLLCIHYKTHTFMETALPFGARSSSYSMQQVACFVVRALERRGANALMYLDDLFIVQQNKRSATKHYEAAVELLEDLGLPIAKD